MKVGLIYTSTTPELIELVEREVRANLGNDVELFGRENPQILATVRDHGYVTAGAAADLIAMYMEAVTAGCDAILNICSSVGEVADSMQTAARYIGVPIVRIDEEMCKDAVRLASAQVAEQHADRAPRIGVMATLPTTLEPTMNTIRRVSRECGQHVELVECLVENAFGLNQDEFKAKMSEYAGRIADDVDVIVFAQGSMAYCEEEIAAQYHKEVLSSPRYGAVALKDALIAKGAMQHA